MAISDFGQLTLSGVSVDNPTSIQFGPDGRLYASQQNGVLKAFTIAKTTTGYQVTGTETIQVQKVVGGQNQFDSAGKPVMVAAVASLPNHDDSGAATSDVGRQVTGLVTTKDSQGRTILYVSSSDPGYSVGEDSNLDTNSGIISRLTQNADGTWSKVDLVRGLPRSEENHATNGMTLGIDAQGHQVLYVAQGGNTNMGAQAGSFSYTPEYYYSGAILKVDLTKLAALEASQGIKGTDTHPWLFDLPTLNDPTRPDASETVFGGNDGLNQAKYDPSEIATVYSPGYRNAYDVVLTSDGKLYTYDNGPNLNWGGKPVNAQGQLIVDANKDGVPDNGPVVDLASEGGSSNYDDQLHLVTAGSYGGHPDPIRASGDGAGLHHYVKNPTTGQWSKVARPVPTDFASVNGGFDDPRQAIYKAPLALNSKGDPFDGSLHSIGASTNGIAEYTAPGDMQGDLLVVSWNGYLYRLPRNSDGTIYSANVEARAVATKPLDVTTPPAGNPFHGTIWVAGYGTDKIYIFDPAAAGDAPANPNDRDKDGIGDKIDPFAADPTNGTANALNGGETLFWSFTEGQTPPNDNSAFFDGSQGLYNGFDIGFTGIMTDGQTLPEGLYFPNNIIPGGAPGMLQVKQVWSGDAQSSKLQNGLQFGLASASDVNDLIVSTTIDNPFDEIGGIPAARDPSQGLFIGTGDQNNYLKLVAVRKSGQAGIEVGQEVAGTYSSKFYALPSLTNITSGDTITLKLNVDRASGVVAPGWTYTVNGGADTMTDLEANGGGAVSTVQLGGDSLKALQGTYAISGKTSALAVGVISSGEQGGVVKAIQAGGSTAYTGKDGTVYQADTGAGFNGKLVKDGAVSGDPMVVSDYAGTADDPLYSDARSTGSETNELTYATSIANGRYELTLQWAEIYQTSIGARVFDVTVEGQKVADDLDLVATVGPNTAYELTVPVTVLDGQLNVSINSDPALGGTDKPTLSAFVLREASSFAADWMDLTVQGTAGTAPPPPPPPPPPSGGDLVAAINIGGTAYTDADTGRAYTADTATAPSPNLVEAAKIANNAGSAIANTNDDALYQSYRYSKSFGYDFAVPGGDYVVELKFSENYWGGAGNRIFDVLLEGQEVISNLDPFAAAGGKNIAYDVSKTVTVTDGTLNLRFDASGTDDKDNAAIGAVVVRKLEGPVGPPPGNAITGTDAAETLNGTAGDDLIHGLGGNDVLNGLAGNDTIEGGTGNDKINGNTGTDALKGQAGNDIYFVDVAADQVIENAGEGTDVINADISYTLPDNAENLLLRTAASINGTGNTLNNRLEGNSGANLLSGGGGNDILLGMAGNDTLEGGAGPDIYLFNKALNGSTNVDQLPDFFAPDDTIQLENGIFTALTTTGTLAASAFHLGTAAGDADDRIIYNQGTGGLFYDANGNAAGSSVQFATLPANLALTNADFVVI